ncbi:hypothetical protein [uncultured Agrobacterium sp.]|uniref:hypothetical protein n=1 Tax=uncultured Agrobacterium sp. TaxID=157277 RepID=UPI0025DB052D|nr:hypothetical protein [uncultured Agrobacterium sp.]
MKSAHLVNDPTAAKGCHVVLILAEKSSVSKGICAALLPKGEKADLYSCVDTYETLQEVEITDDILLEPGYELYERALRREQNVESRSFFSGSVEKRAQNRRYDFDRPRTSNERYEKQSERIRISAISFDNKIIIILDTNGNPLTLRGQRNAIVNGILNGAPAQEILRSLRHALGADSSRRSAPYMRMKLFSDILVHQRLPFRFNEFAAGTPITLDAIVGATDTDVAGQYIFYSVVEYANQLRARLGYGNLDDNLIRRLDSDVPPRESVRKAMSEIGSFPLGSALGGKTRDVFDRLFDYVLNGEFRRQSRGKSRFTLGRVRWLGLAALVEECLVQDRSKPIEYFYLFFDKNCGRTEIERRLTEKKYAAAHCTINYSRITVSRYIDICREGRIGTHTTRYNNPSDLGQNGLVRIDNTFLRPTELSFALYKEMREILDPKSGVSIGSLNAELNEFIDLIETCVDPAECRELHERFLARMVQNLKTFLLRLRSTDLQQVLDRLPEARSEVGSRQRTKHRKRDFCAKKTTGSELDSSTGLLTLVGPYSVVPVEIIQQYREDNFTLRALNRVEQQVDNAGEIYAARRLLRLPASFSFQAIDVFKPSIKSSIDDTDCTVFRAPISLSDLLEAVEIDGSLPEARTRSWVPFEFNQRETTDVEAHDPLYISDIRRSDISTREKRLVAREYLLPWRLNDAIARQNEQGGESVASFSLSLCGVRKEVSLNFERVEWTTIGKVHNFESMLAVMEGKYGMPVRQTADIMEDLYLGV